MEKVIIRKGTIKDLKAVQELNHLLFKKEQKEYEPTYDLDWTFGPVGTEVFKRNLTQKGRCIFVAQKNERIIGYIAGRSLEKGSRYAARTVKGFAEIDNMFVLKGQRSNGIGSKLLKELFSWCKKRKIERVKVAVAPKNRKGIGFYEKNGFKEHDIILEAKP